MKKTLFFILFVALFGSAASAQKIYSTDRAFVTQTVNEILSTTVNKYSLVKVDSSNRKGVLLVYSDGVNELEVFFWKKQVGGNKDLDTAPTVQYVFANLKGIYKDVFPYWQKLFESSANFVSTANYEHGSPKTFSFQNTEYIARFNKYAGIWSLDVVPK